MWLVLLFLFLALPLLELYILIQVGQVIGAWPVIAIVVVDGALGAYLAKSQGRATWRRFNEAMRAGRVPGKEIFDGAMVIFGGALLITPGFITDAVGLLLLVPPTRDALRGFAARRAKQTPAGRPIFFVYDRHRAGRGSRPGAPRPPRPPRPPGSPVSRDYDIEGSGEELGGEPELPRRVDEG